MTPLLFALYATAYIIIGIVVGRTWKLVCDRRKYGDFTHMYAAVGAFWCFMMFVVPAVFILYHLSTRVLAPAIGWILRGVDAAVLRLVPEKAD